VRGLVFVLVIVIGLMAAAAATGYTVASKANVRPGGSSLFIPSGWFCRNLKRRVECYSGDAKPWAELTGTRNGGVTVRVHTLNHGGVAVRTIHHPPGTGGGPGAWDEIVYTFSAL